MTCIITSIGNIYGNNQRQATILTDTNKSVDGIITLVANGDIHFVSNDPPPQGTVTFVSCDTDFANLKIGDILTF
jgi:hypothetical protein